MITSPYQKYQQSSVQTASPAKLVLILYDGAIRFVKQGIDAIDHRNIEKANHNLVKAQGIVHELIAALDFQYPVASDLVRIYEYMLHQLITANVKKESEPAGEVLAYLTDLKEAWTQAAKPTSQSGPSTQMSHG